MDQKLIAKALIVFMLALFQGTALPMAFGVKINIILIAVLLCAFTAHSFFEYAVVIAAALFGLARGAPLDYPLVAFGAVMAAGYGIRPFLPFQPFMNYCAALVVATAALYAAIDWHFIARTPFLFAEEILFTVVLGACAYLMIKGK